MEQVDSQTNILSILLIGMENKFQLSKKPLLDKIHM